MNPPVEVGEDLACLTDRSGSMRPLGVVRQSDRPFPD